MLKFPTFIGCSLNHYSEAGSPYYLSIGASVLLQTGHEINVWSFSCVIYYNNRIKVLDMGHLNSNANLFDTSSRTVKND